MEITTERLLRVDPELKSLIPPLSQEEWEGLERSILDEGIRDPIVVWGDVIVDGHNRYEIAIGHNESGEVLPFASVQREFPDKTAAKIWIIENQLHQRRNLSDADRIELAETQRELIEASQPKGGRPPKDSEEEKPAQNSAPVSEEKDERSTNAKIGKKAGVSRDTVSKYREVKRFGDERLIEGLRGKLFSMDNAYHLALVGRNCGNATYEALWENEDEDAKVRFSTSQLKHLLSLAKKGNDDEITADLVEIVESRQPHPKNDKPITSVHKAHELREAERKKLERDLKRAEDQKDFEATPLPDRKYEVLYADPPWRYEHSKTASREVENQYPTMSLDEIKALEVASLACEDSILFLWATSPKLLEALEVMDAWGFSYRTCMVWVKDKIGMGYYARQKHELLLIGRKGDIAAPEEANRPPSVIESPRTAHSAKPTEFYESIEKMYPGHSKLELFARTGRSSWDSWGNQFPSA